MLHNSIYLPEHVFQIPVAKFIKGKKLLNITICYCYDTCGSFFLISFLN